MRDKKDCMVRIFNFHKLLIIIKAATFAMLLPLRYYVRMCLIKIVKELRKRDTYLKNRAL